MTCPIWGWDEKEEDEEKKDAVQHSEEGEEMAQRPAHPHIRTISETRLPAQPRMARSGATTPLRTKESFSKLFMALRGH